MTLRHIFQLARIFTFQSTNIRFQLTKVYRNVGRLCHMFKMRCVNVNYRKQPSFDCRELNFALVKRWETRLLAKPVREGVKSSRTAANDLRRALN